MEDYVFQIRKFLPIKFDEEESNIFLSYLQEAYIENVNSGKYQFAFIAFHMLYMSFCYKAKWFLKTQNNVKINESIDTYVKQNKKAFFNGLFDLAQFNESDTIHHLLSSIGFDFVDVKKCKDCVETRNNCSHANGKIRYQFKDINETILKELDCIEKIQEQVKATLVAFFEDFINENWNKGFLGGEIRSRIQEENLSEKDLENLASMKLSFLNKKSTTQDVVFKKILYITFLSEIAQYIDLEKPVFIDALKAFMDGLPKGISVINEDNECKTLSDQKIIEEYLTPLLVKFSFIDWEETSNILRI